MSKKVSFGAEARGSLQAGLDILANAVKATLGPKGRHAAIERAYGPPLITKDGVTVARSIDLSDHMENMGAALVKSVASNTNSLAGDGTTTATVLAQAIYREGAKLVSAGHNPVLLKRGIDIAVSEVVSHLKNMSVDVSGAEMIQSIAIISANNDKELGSLIGEVVSSVGDDGLISVEESAGAETSVSYADGLSFDRGYVTPAFVNNTARLTTDFSDAFILLYDGRISKTSDLMPVMEIVADTGKPLLIVAQTVENEALQTMVLNTSRGSLASCAVRSPGFGDIRRDIMEDLAVLCGAKLMTSDTEGQLRSIALTDLGRARKITVSRDSTTIIDGAGTQESVENRIIQIKEHMTQTNLESYEISALRQRLSALDGSVAVLRVGGVSEEEVREKRDRVEDAINAVKAAIEEGVVPGGGSALLHCVSFLEERSKELSLTTEESLGLEVVLGAIKAPFSQILTNAGINYHLNLDSIVTSDNKLMGYNALLGRMEEDMIGAGIIDPAKVVRTALENAASSSGTLLTTEVAIFSDDEKIK